VFLKVVQWVLLEFVLKDLQISDAAHAFERGRSIVSNALPHVGQRFVAGFDIKDFFGSVTTKQVEALLLKNGYLAEEADIIARLCTKDGRLPQGAPTSPLLSNALLFDFDEWSVGEAKENRLIYTRYADDITVSSESREALKNFIARAGEYLKIQFAFRLNDQKTRIASLHGRQVVTGVVVNEKATPSRDRLRRIRVIFHQASAAPKAFESRSNEMAGLIGYISQFPKLRGSKQVEEYSAVLAKVRRVAVRAGRRKRTTTANAL
jgi:RNA-directed DNA polymerase